MHGQSNRVCDIHILSKRDVKHLKQLTKHSLFQMLLTTVMPVQDMARRTKVELSCHELSSMHRRLDFMDR